MRGLSFAETQDLGGGVLAIAEDGHGHSIGTVLLSQVLLDFDLVSRDSPMFVFPVQGWLSYRHAWSSAKQVTKNIKINFLTHLIQVIY
jgi:hypothetical protein